MLDIQHKGIQHSLPLDKTDFVGDLVDDVNLPYVQSLIAGRLGTLDKYGNVQLMDGASWETSHFMGFLINDAKGYFFENTPAIASGLVALSQGNQVVITDQIAPAITITPSERLYAGKGAELGLITNIPPSGPDSIVIGIAASQASAASPDLRIIV